MDDLLTKITRKERDQFLLLKTPKHIQDWLDNTPYSEDEFYRCPMRVLRDRKAHCFDGALFAAAALRLIGHPPLIIELIPNANDDDHLLAAYQINRCWGAIAQSNFTGLRFREPIYRTIRELTISYFDDFFNSAGEKTLRAYRGPFDLRTFEHLHWMTQDDGLEALATGMDRYRVIPLITSEMESALTPVDTRSLRAGLLGSNPAGLFKVHP